MDEKKEYFRLLLHEAAVEGNTEKVIQLLERKDIEEDLLPEIVNSVNDERQRETCLHLGCRAGNLAMVRGLLNHSANMYLLDGFSKLPLHYACERGFYKIARMMLSWPSNAFDLSLDLDTQGASVTLLQAAVRAQSLNLASLLLEKGAKVDGVNGHGESALHFAAQLDDVPIANLLLEHGASVALKVHPFGETALHFACKHGSKNVALLLAKAGANIHEENQTAIPRSPLRVARDCGYHPLCIELIKISKQKMQTSAKENEVQREAIKAKLKELRIQNGIK